MKRKYLKKYLTVIMAVMLLFSNLSYSIMANENQTETNSVEQELLDDNGIEQGDFEEVNSGVESYSGIISPFNVAAVRMYTEFDPNYDTGDFSNQPPAGTQEVDSLQEFEITVNWTAANTKDEIVSIQSNNDSEILIYDESDVVFYYTDTNGANQQVKDISDLDITDEGVNFKTPNIKGKRGYIVYKVRAPLSNGEFDVISKVANSILSRSFVVNNGLTVYTTEEILVGAQPFNIYGQINYKGHLTGDVEVALDIYNKETGEYIDEMMLNDKPDSNDYLMGPDSFLEYCKDGTYVVEVSLFIGDTLVGSAKKEIQYFRYKEFKLTIWDVMKEKNSENNVSEIRTSREFIYKNEDIIEPVVPYTIVDSEVTIEIPEILSKYFTVDGNENIVGIMPIGDAEITIIYEKEEVYKSLVSINVVKEEDKVYLDKETKAFNYLWVANSSTGTVLKINTDTGDILGEYKTAPEGQPLNPSRTTVDKDGNLWVANRNGNSVTKIGLIENGQYRKGTNGQNTSKGFKDIKPWTNAGGADTNGGASTAADDAIMQYVRTTASGTRHISINEDNNVWVSGSGANAGSFDLIDNNTGEIIRKEKSVGFGGYGGLIDPKGFIWSTTAGNASLLRWDTSKPLSGPAGQSWNYYNASSYGIAIDSKGNVWVSALGDGKVRKYNSDGILVGAYNQGSLNSQGLVVGHKDEVWVTHYLESHIGRLDENGNYIGDITVPGAARGLAVDNNGYIWGATSNGYIFKIDPNKGKAGEEVQRIYVGGDLYNYSDMTGSTLIGAPSNGTWSFQYDSQLKDIQWDTIEWEPENPEGTTEVWISSSVDDINYSEPVLVENGQKLNIPDGRYVKVSIHLHRLLNVEDPIIKSVVIKGVPKN